MPETGGTSFGKIVLGVGCGVVLAVVAMLGMCTMCVGKVAMDATQAVEKEKREKQQALAAVDIQDLHGERDGEWIKITGRVHNGGGAAVTFVKVQAEFLDKRDNVIDTDWTYAVSSEPLQPGQSKSFDIMQRAGTKASDYRVHVVQE